MLKKVMLLSSLFYTQMAFGQSVTDAEIDLYLESLPQTKDLVTQIQTGIKESGEKNRKELSWASMEGRVIRTTVELSEDAAQKEKLTTLIKSAGFNSLDEWAITGDRIMGVLSSVQWVTSAASIPNANGEESDIKPDTNIFEYIADETKPEKDRKKYQTQLGEMCERLCYDQEDFDVVAARYTEITDFLQSLK